MDEVTRTLHHPWEEVNRCAVAGSEGLALGTAEASAGLDEAVQEEGVAASVVAVEAVQDLAVFADLDVAAPLAQEALPKTSPPTSRRSSTSNFWV